MTADITMHGKRIPLKSAFAGLHLYIFSGPVRIDCFMDPGLTMPHCSPLIADSFGDFPNLYYDKENYRNIRYELWDQSELVLRLG